MMITIEIDGLPFLKMVIFHGELLNNQMVYIITINPMWTQRLSEAFAAPQLTQLSLEDSP